MSAMPAVFILERSLAVRRSAKPGNIGGNLTIDAGSETEDRLWELPSNLPYIKRLRRYRTAAINAKRGGDDLPFACKLLRQIDKKQNSTPPVGR